MFKRIILYAAAAVLGVGMSVIVTATFTVVSVNGSSMEPAIEDGSKVLVNKLAYSKMSQTPAIGDIVAFKSDVFSEDGEGSILVRRVTGKPGDTVEIKDNIFYLNGNPYDEYMKEPVHMDDMEKIILADDEIFVLSDNRKFSMDSRDEAVGVLKIEECVGKGTLKWRGIK